MLTEKEKKQLKVIEKQLQLPKWKYVLKHGVLFWGISATIFLTIFNLLFFQKSLQELWDINLFIKFIIFALVGIVVGLMMRNFSTKQSQKLKAKEITA